MLKVKRKMYGINFDVNFTDRINLLKGASGTGKTFLLNALASYCTDNKIKYAFINYKFLATRGESSIFAPCLNEELILLDNADLYLTPELFDEIRSLDATIIMSMKTTFGLNMDDVHVYSVDYDGSSLATRRWC